MAKQYRALSNIEHGEETSEGNEITRFPFGSIVEGLDKDTMKALWDAGVLEEVEAAPPAPTKTVVPKPDQGAGDGSTNPDQGAGDGATTESPAAPSSTGGSPKP